MTDVRRIVAAAIMHNGKPYSVPPPGRHHTVIRMLDQMFPGAAPFTGKQGFVLDDGTFLDRKSAAKQALAVGQITREKWGDRLDHPSFQLYSEDLW